MQIPSQMWTYPNFAGQGAFAGDKDCAGPSLMRSSYSSENIERFSQRNKEIATFTVLLPGSS
jgi:hypothetical protein